jgi:2-desacetyl-2-hydroxyethyl bacteriochlorophyllide A dehydrogenase
MKAVVYEKRGAAEKLALRDVEKPKPGPGEVLVKIHTSSVNAGDCRMMRMGSIPKGGIFGSDIAGVVEEVGANVRSLRPGAAVAGDISGCGLGGFAEYVAVPADALVKKPANLPFEQAAALPVAATAALQALRKCGEIRPGQKVLVCGAGGGVGTFTVQLLKHFGAEVTAVCGPQNAELMRTLGADHTIDYTHEDFAKAGDRYDAVVAVNGRRSLSAYRRVLRQGGAAVVVGGQLYRVLAALLLGPLLSLGGKTMRVLVSKPDAKDLELLLKLAADGAIRPVIDRQFPLCETAAAVRYVGEGHAHGKVILSIEP